MLPSKIIRMVVASRSITECLKVMPLTNRNLSVSTVKLCDTSEESKQVTLYRSFEDIKDKNKDTYLDMIRIFLNRDYVYRRGHVEFIYAALKNMESFGVHKDLEVYKSLIDVLPKGKFIPTNMFQVEFMHYPKQQQCIIDLLEQMEDNGVMPDYEMEDLLRNIFGNKGFPLRKYWRMMYWMPKFKNASPWLLPNPLPSDVLELAKLAIHQICSVDVQTQITVYQSRDIEDSIDDTWIVSAQSPIQRSLLRDHDVKQPVYVEGAFRVWLKSNQVNYFVLRADPKPLKTVQEDSDDVSNIKVPFMFNIKPPIKKHLQLSTSVHTQEDGVILALCATGTSSKDSLLSWIRHLEMDGNPTLADVPIVFTLKSGVKEVATVIDNEQNKEVETSK
ncbi:ECSIT domain containing protein [Asbolus verrucosus]|uniref:Evolutionarily conserved signaling intermediate in Toll pathway, mitochondrial n=1 Tax=Asbolus verrucosus TaxID=1661398 RepID=A0A482VWH4_ASBVE|nr:ECSIT domain containing protein [Asbolus verrucosus]